MACWEWAPSLDCNPWPKPQARLRQSIFAQGETSPNPGNNSLPAPASQSCRVATVRECQHRSPDPGDQTMTDYGPEEAAAKSGSIGMRVRARLGHAFRQLQKWLRYLRR